MSAPERRNCIMQVISERGATLAVEGSIAGLNLKEFLLLLSATGLAYRRCELDWVQGEQIGASFLIQKKRKPESRPDSA
jgi:hypothetical protein